MAFLMESRFTFTLFLGLLDTGAVTLASTLEETQPLLTAQEMRPEVAEEGLAPAQALMQSADSQAKAHSILLLQSASNKQEVA